jgi:hypothetical protein
MVDWTDKPDFDPPPGKTDPLPSALDDGWREWIKREIEDARKEKYGPGSSKTYDFKFKCEKTGEHDLATGGGVPGAWETEPVTSKTRPPAEYKDFTRFRRKYPTLTITRYEVFKVTLTITFPQPDGGTFERTSTFWKPIRTTAYRDIFVYRWWQTSGIRVVSGKELEWYDASISEGWNGLVKLWPEDQYVSPPENPPDSLFSVAPSPGPTEGELAAFRPIRPQTVFAFGDIAAVSEAALLDAIKG